MEFALRPAAIDDAATIASIQAASWRATYPGIVPAAFLNSLETVFPVSRWEEYLAGDATRTFVAHDPAGIFGFTSGGPARDPSGGYDAELYAIYLLAQRHRQGAGRRLVHTLAEALRTQAFRSLLVWVLEQNPAVSFYRRLGAIEIARKSIEIGGIALPEIAFGWQHLQDLQ